MKLLRFYNHVVRWKNNLYDIRVKKSIFILFVAKIIYTLYGVFVFSKISSISDADSYLNAPIIISQNLLVSNTVLMGTITALLKRILFIDFFVHLAYSLFSFYCLKLLIESLKLSRKLEYFLVFMLILPSFGTWTSVIVKESLSCSLSSIGLIWIVNLINNEKIRFPMLINIICIYFTLVLRPIIGFSLISLISTIYVYRVPFLNKYAKAFFIIGFITIFSGAAVFLALNYIKDEFIPLAEYYFDPRFSTSKSARPLGFWKTAADFYLKAPEGIFIANLGPNLIESINNPFFIPYFFEGLIFIGVTFYLLITNILYEIRRAIFNPVFLFTIFFGIIVVLLFNYPFGLYNPGSAIRYRCSYYHVIIVLLLLFYSNEKKIAVRNLTKL